MNKKCALGFIGTGQMGTAILEGIAGSEKSNDYEFLIVNRNMTHSRRTKEAVEHACNNVDIAILEDNQKLCEASDIIFLGVRPQDMEDVLKGLECSGKIVVSMAAGVSLSYMKRILGNDVKLIRIMPNVPVTVKNGVISISKDTDVDDDSLNLVKDAIGLLGHIVEVKEELVNCITGMCGSGPAYVYMFAKAMASCGEENGLSHDEARALAAMTILGAAELILNSTESLPEMIDSMCLPQGTTVAGVKELREHCFEESVKKGIQAAVDRSAEMFPDL